MQNIRVVELFAGVGGFRVGLEGASDRFVTIWSNQWEPSTRRQDATLIYRSRFGAENHVNRDINKVNTDEIPNHDLLVAGFPCQDYSVAGATLSSQGIKGSKGMLWWQIYRILEEKGDERAPYLFLENVDRLLGSPAKQRGRDFAIILASLADLGYTVEWRVVNAADYGMPQRRRRTYILAYRDGSRVAERIEGLDTWVRYDGVMARAFPFTEKPKSVSAFRIEGSIQEVSAAFNLGRKESPFGTAGVMRGREVYSLDTVPVYDGPRMTLGGQVVDESLVPEEFFINDADFKKWEYEKGAKKITRISPEGYEYVYSEGGMAFPDSLLNPSRTIITGEGGASPSRFKHVIETPSGRHRRLVPLELERLNMFPDNHTLHPEVSDGRRAFLMGNALVCGIVQEIGRWLYRFIYDREPVSTRPIELQRDAHPTLALQLFADTTTDLVSNRRRKTMELDPTKDLLIGFVKPDHADYFLDGMSEKIYHTGKTRSFPSTIALNKLYYFMPYIKGKGVRDLYLIRRARIGSKSEVVAGCNDTEPRLLLELEYLRSLPAYQPVRLNIFQTYRNTKLGTILS